MPGRRRASVLPELSLPQMFVQGARVLVVDDNVELRDLYAAILTFSGYKVTIASDGAEAIQKISRMSFDLILTDRQMPVIDVRDDDPGDSFRWNPRPDPDALGLAPRASPAAGGCT